jgi:hypothetical protein
MVRTQMIIAAILVTLSALSAATGTVAELIPPDLVDVEVVQNWVARGIYDRSQADGYLRDRSEHEVALLDISDVIALGCVARVSETPVASNAGRQTVVLAVDECLKGDCGDTLVFHSMAHAFSDRQDAYGLDECAVVSLITERGDGLWSSGNRYVVLDGVVVRKGMGLSDFLAAVRTIVERRSPAVLLREASFLAIGVVEDFRDIYSTDARIRVPAERYILFYVQLPLKGKLPLGPVRVDMNTRGTIRSRDVPRFAVGDTCALFMSPGDSGGLRLLGGKAAKLSRRDAIRLIEDVDSGGGTSPN